MHFLDLSALNNSIEREFFGGFGTEFASKGKKFSIPVLKKFMQPAVFQESAMECREKISAIPFFVAFLDSLTFTERNQKDQIFNDYPFIGDNFSIEIMMEEINRLLLQDTTSNFEERACFRHFRASLASGISDGRSENQLFLNVPSYVQNLYFFD